MDMSLAKKIKFPNTILTNEELLKFAKPYPLLILLTIVLGFSGALFNGVGTTLVVPVVLKIVGQQINLQGGPPIFKAVLLPFDHVPENYRLLVMSGAIILTIVLKNLANYASTLASSSLSRAITSDMREAGVIMLLEIDLTYYTKMKIGDLINSLGGEIGRAASALCNIIQLVIISITILVFVGLLLSISWQLTIATTILLSLVTLINQSTISRSKEFGKNLSDLSRAYSIAILETLNGIRLVKATGNEDREFHRIKKLIRDREKAEFKSQVHSEIIAPASEVTGIITLMLIVFLGRTFFAKEVTSVSAVLLTYLLVLLRLLPFVSQLNSLRNSFANAAPSVGVAVDFLRWDNKPFMGEGSITYSELQKGVHFDSLSFGYPGHEKLVLHDINLYLSRGKTLALVGGSGAGKSTLADLLPRFYDPVSGCIKIDGIDLREFELKSLRKVMGIVSQDTFLFNNTVRNNIAYGKPEATEDEIIHAAKQANAYEFIVKLAQGFDTLIGDRGVMLSGGQRQRLAIARALLQDPEILILDEATSALDTVSERLVQQAIDDLSRDRTTLVIAHRLSTVQKADQIAVLEQGRVVEVGTHQELLQKGGYYFRLYSMQFREQEQEVNERQQTLISISGELRTRLNSTMDLLRLLLGQMNNVEERQELIEESYKSALKLNNMIDILEDFITSKMNFIPDKHQIATESERLNQIYQQLRIDMNPLLKSLHILANNSVEPYQEQSELNNSFNSAMNLIETIKVWENNLNQAND